MNFANICRTCMSDESLKPIFKLNENNAVSTNDIFLACGIKVVPGDKLPQNMCTSCSLHIHEILKFRNRCKNIEQQLLKIISHSNVLKYLDTAVEETNISENESSVLKKDNFLTIKIESNDIMEIKSNSVVVDTEIDDQPLKYLVFDKSKEGKIHVNSNSSSNQDGFDAEFLYSEEQFNSGEDFKTVNKISNKLDIIKTESKKINKKRVIKEKSFKIKKGQIKKIIKNIKKKETADIVNKSEQIHENSEIENIEISEKYIENDKELTNLSFSEQVTDLPYTIIQENGRNTKVECRVCLKILSIRSIDLHMDKIHPGQDQRKVKCELCDGYFMKIMLKRHVKLMHGNGAFICRYCKSNYKSKERLLEHYPSCTAKKMCRTKTNKRETAECDICHQKMQKQSLRLHHKLIHDGLKPVCEHCGKPFGNKYRLLEHYRAKHGYPKHQCSICDFQCASVMGIKNHERRHRGEKPFICETCGAKFHAAYLLTQHKHSHNTQKTIKCDLCPSSFKTTNCLSMHKTTCHSSALYTCTICCRTYKCRHYAVKHLRLIHNVRGKPALTMLMANTEPETAI